MHEQRPRHVLIVGPIRHASTGSNASIELHFCASVHPAVRTGSLSCSCEIQLADKVQHPVQRERPHRSLRFNRPLQRIFLGLIFTGLAYVVGAMLQQAITVGIQFCEDHSDVRLVCFLVQSECHPCALLHADLQWLQLSYPNQWYRTIRTWLARCLPVSRTTEQSIKYHFDMRATECLVQTSGG